MIQEKLIFYVNPYKLVFSEIDISGILFEIKLANNRLKIKRKDHPISIPEGFQVVN